MKKFCVIGNPISHSLSPAIFKYLFKFFNINANYHSVFLDNDKSMIDFISNNIGLYNGYNITAPFKNTAFNVADELDPLAAELGSVNCINIDNLKLLGFNTDHYGFINMITSNQIQLNNKKIIVLGYGGAARAVIFSLLKEYNCDIYIYGRDFNKINNLIKKAQHQYGGRTISMYNNTITNDVVLINCLPLKIDSNNLNSLLSYLPISTINTCIDINYVESDISLEIKKSCKVISGLDMLIYQALKSFDIWFNCTSLEKINYLDLKKSIL